jgi:hypothetical protein
VNESDAAEDYMKKAFIISLGCEDRLKIIRDVLKDKYSCKIFISDFDHAKKKYIEAKDSECNYVHVPQYQKNISIGRIRAYISFASQVKRLLEMEKPELVYIMLPPNTIAYECARYKERNPSSKLIADVYDLWPESFPLQSISKYIPHILSKWKSYRTYVLKRADYIFTECKYYNKVVGPELIPEEKTSVLYIHKEQGTAVQEIVEKSIRDYKKNPGSITLGYLGSINNIIDIKGITDLISRLRSKGIAVTVKIVGGGEGAQKFIDSIEAVGAQVKNYGFVFDPVRKAEIFSNCDFALNMMVENIVVGLTTKSVDYFSLALPIINNIKADTSDLINTRGVGINYNQTIEQILCLTDEDIARMKNRAYQCYQELMTPQGLSETVKTAFEKMGII